MAQRSLIGSQLDFATINHTLPTYLRLQEKAFDRAFNSAPGLFQLAQILVAWTHRNRVKYHELYLLVLGTVLHSVKAQPTIEIDEAARQHPDSDVKQGPLLRILLSAM